MTFVTHTEFDGKTEGATVAAAYAGSIKGRTVLITGANKRGIGFGIAQALASQSPQRLILAGRSTAKVQECIDALRSQYPDSDIDYRLLQVDLSAQESVRSAAATVLGWADVPTIDLVINNAGVMNLPERQVSAEGLEMHLATNHVGHFLLTNLILPKVIAAAEAKNTATDSGSGPGAVRIINLTSLAAYLSGLRASDMDFSKPTSELPEKERPNAAFLRNGGLAADDHLSYIPMAAYGHSKTCNILFSVALNQRLYDKYGILSLSLHPGEVRSELSRTTDQDWLDRATKSRESVGFFWKTASQAAGTVLVAALDPNLTRPEPAANASPDGNGYGHGYFLNDCHIGKAPAHAVDEADAAKLWELTEGVVSQDFAW